MGYLTAEEARKLTNTTIEDNPVIEEILSEILKATEAGEYKLTFSDEKKRVTDEDIIQLRELGYSAVRLNVKMLFKTDTLIIVNWEKDG